jgi:hypothetical protein
VLFFIFFLSKKEVIRDEANFSAGFSESEVVAHDHQTSTLRKETMECLNMERRCQHHLHHVKAVFMADISISSFFHQQKRFFSSICHADTSKMGQAAVAGIASS